jgi:hypothetical protein
MDNKAFEDDPLEEIPPPTANGNSFHHKILNISSWSVKQCRNLLPKLFSEHITHASIDVVTPRMTQVVTRKLSIGPNIPSIALQSNP